VRRGTLIVIAGPSGVGKGTVVERLLARDPDRLAASVSVTTRDARPEEIDGVHYRFVGDAEFDRMIDQGELLEWAEIVGHRSGTPRLAVERLLEQGKDVILEIDVQGARQVRDRVPDALLIFLAPPTLEELERRLRGRGTEPEASIRRRLGPMVLRVGHERRRRTRHRPGRCYHRRIPHRLTSQNASGARTHDRTEDR